MITFSSRFSRVFLILIFASALSLSRANAQSGGRLIILRAPNFGSKLALNVKIDGRTVANVVQGRSYDHFIPAGRHVLTVTPTPAVNGYPASINLNVQAGESYVFMAVWQDSSRIALRPTQLTPRQLADLQSQ